MKKVKYIFCINTGRAGSHYLSQLFTAVPGCRAFHESSPIGNGYAMRRYLAGCDRPMRTIVEEKVRMIKAIDRECDHYVETNHCFIKGFGWLLPEYLPQADMGVIFLTRSKKSTVESLQRIACHPLTEVGRDWIMTPAMLSPIACPPRRFLSPRIDYQLIRTFSNLFGLWKAASKKLRWDEPRPPGWLNSYVADCLDWYFDETQLKADLYQKTFPSISFKRIDVEELNTLSGVRDMMDFFGCGWNEAIAKVISQATNLKIRPHRRGNE